jgi:hypothetical protein
MKCNTKTRRLEEEPKEVLMLRVSSPLPTDLEEIVHINFNEVVLQNGIKRIIL